MGLLNRIAREAAATSPAPSDPPASAVGYTAIPPRLPGGLSRAGSTESNRDLKTRVKGKLIAELNPNTDVGQIDEVRRQLKQLFDQIIDLERFVLTRVERDRLFEEISADVVGFGPIEPLLVDPGITEVMVNGPEQIYIEQKGKLILTDVKFDNDDHVRRIIDRIKPTGVRPKFMPKLEDAGVRLPATVFGISDRFF